MTQEQEEYLNEILKRLDGTPEEYENIHVLTEEGELVLKKVRARKIYVSSKDYRKFCEE